MDLASNHPGKLSTALQSEGWAPWNKRSAENHFIRARTGGIHHESVWCVWRSSFVRRWQHSRRLASLIVQKQIFRRVGCDKCALSVSDRRGRSEVGVTGMGPIVAWNLFRLPHGEAKRNRAVRQAQLLYRLQSRRAGGDTDIPLKSDSRLHPRLSSGLWDFHTSWKAASSLAWKPGLALLPVVSWVTALCSLRTRFRSPAREERARRRAFRRIGTSLCTHGRQCLRLLMGMFARLNLIDGGHRTGVGA